jgi:hypothetical protein
VEKFREELIKLDREARDLRKEVRDKESGIGIIF